MKKIIIIGGGGFGREVLMVAYASLQPGEWMFKGFLDDEKLEVRVGSNTYSVLGKCKEYVPEEGDSFICSIANPTDKMRICTALRDKGAQFMNLIHPSAFVSPDAELGVGLIAFPNAFISTQTTIGDFVTLNVAATIGHDAVLAQGCTLSAHCDITGFVTLERGVFMGTHAAVLPGKTVGEFAKIGAGSVVMRDVLAKHTVFGVPAKTIMES